MVAEPVVAELVDPGALRLRALVLAFLLVGFTLGVNLGVPVWAVTGLAVAGLAVRERSFPVRSIPLDAVVLVAGLAVLAAAAAPFLPIEEVVGGQGPVAQVRAAVGAAIGANLFNNLPALLVALPVLDDSHPDQLWAVLVGANIGPVLLVGGSLSTLLWLRTVQGLGVEVNARDFLGLGLRVGLPALGAAIAVPVLVSLT